MKYLLIAFSAWFLVACTTTSTDKAGLTEVHVGRNSDGQPMVNVFDGKERKDVTLKWVQEGVLVEYAAREVKSFEGQEIAAAAERAWAEAVVKMVPEAKDAFTAFMGALFKHLSGGTL